jgi:hypothetical protein
MGHVVHVLDEIILCFSFEFVKSYEIPMHITQWSRL